MPGPPGSSSTSSRARMEQQLPYLQQERASASKTRVHEIKSSCQKAQTLDLTFVLDATTSMKSHSFSFEMLKYDIIRMAEGMSRSYPECQLLLQAIGITTVEKYKALMDEILRAIRFGECFHWTGEGGKVRLADQAGANIQLLSGGDVAEDVFTGLEKARRLDWRAMNRVLVHIGDAPCHSWTFHAYGGAAEDDFFFFFFFDDYPQGYRYGRSIQTILRTLRETCQVTNNSFCHISRQTYRMIQEFRKAAGGDGWIREWQISDLREIAETVITACRASITSSISLVQHGVTGQQTYVKVKIDPRMPYWNRVIGQEATEFVHRQCSSFDQLLRIIREARPLELIRSPESADSALLVQIAVSSFSDGGDIRHPYYALVKERDTSKPAKYTALAS
ncbi:hypothetical protein R1sor_014947 [Riccia sorocarpa]|uniref:Uncharacterized protein n=1 Tax=Riccia sorocarpa TaxID=122646 RepID=A0ABD3HAU6_9MARC